MKRIGILFIITALATTIIFSGCGKNNSDKSESSTVESSKAKISQPVSKDNVSSKDNEEGLNDRTINESVKLIANCDMLIIGGTSLNVYPAAGLIQYFNGKYLVLINKSETPVDRKADIVIHDSIGKVLSNVIE
jgi:NAD-dependent SIR2 family protein deacetylase